MTLKQIIKLYFNGTLPAVNTVLASYTVPSGKKVLVKDIIRNVITTSTGNQKVRIEIYDGTNSYYIDELNTYTAGVTVLARNTVAESGDVIRVRVNYTMSQSCEFSVLVSGLEE